MRKSVHFDRRVNRWRGIIYLPDHAILCPVFRTEQKAREFVGWSGGCKQPSCLQCLDGKCGQTQIEES